VLTEQVAALATGKKQNTDHGTFSPMRRCFRCQQPGHVQRNCPTLRQCYICGRQGHLAKECCSGNGRGMSQGGQGHPKAQY
jgi:hypothetical protein